MDKIEKIRNELERRIALYSGWSNETVHPTRIDEDKQLLSFLDTLKEEPDKSLDEAATKFAYSEGYQDPEYYNIVDAFKTGAEFGANHLRNSTKMVDKGLEEAADNFVHFYDNGTCDGIAQDCFIAGAKWQEKRDEETIKTAEDHAFLAGADWQEEQMLKDAMEGEVHPDDCEIWVNLIEYGYKFNDGDKIRIIIVKDK